MIIKRPFNWISMKRFGRVTNEARTDSLSFDVDPGFCTFRDNAGTVPSITQTNPCRGDDLDGSSGIWRHLLAVIEYLFPP